MALVSWSELVLWRMSSQNFIKLSLGVWQFLGGKINPSILLSPVCSVLELETKFPYFEVF